MRLILCWDFFLDRTKRDMKVPRPREDGNAAGQHLRRARDSGPGYAVAFFLVVRGLTENNVCLVRALSGRVAGR